MALALPPSGLPRPRDDRPGDVRSSPPAQLDGLLADAIRQGGSDIHLEPDPEGNWSVRLRVDGLLRPLDGYLAAGAGPLVLSRLKVLAGLDIAIRRRPQDGGFTHEAEGRSLRIRVSTLPVEGGEKAVLRILDPTSRPEGLDHLGFSPEDLGRVRGLIRGGRGVILTTGPTGSGKSSTLVAALGEVDTRGLNVVTLEDPVEYRIPRVQQVQLAPGSGLTFPVALRAVLRQDPDVIMVGEIRDRETAEIAMSAAITGHLVLSSLHTSDAVGAIPRLLHMGVPPHLVAGGLAGVVGQRLLRRRCPACGGTPIGCDRCVGGYRGRIGAFEVLVPGEALRDAILRSEGTPQLRALARRGGMRFMAEDARQKAAEGHTTLHEVSRVLHRDPGAAPPCPACGLDPPEGAISCPGCAAALVRVCTPCSLPLAPTWQWCPRCRRRAPPG
jgi:type II secretory ATPase GspE/PulE/Tfp pilus assembly ATPase PilB-like protein